MRGAKLSALGTGVAGGPSRAPRLHRAAHMLPSALLSDEPGVPGLVSVVIPSYNRGYILDRAIESALSQTYPHVEVIVVDDGSTDDTGAVAARYGSRIRYIRKENGGVSSARNRGFAESRGEFVALLDSDDGWLPWKLAAQVAILQRDPTIGMVWTDMIADREGGEVASTAYLRTMYSAHSYVRIEEICERVGTLGDLLPDAPADMADRPVYAGDVFPAMMFGNLVHTSTVVMRRERLRGVGGFDESLRPAGEDYEFHVHTTSLGRVGFLDAPTILYRIGNEDAITTPRWMIYLARANLNTVRKWMEREHHRIALPPDLVARRMAECYAWLGGEELEKEVPGGGTANLLRSLRYDPRQPRVALQLALSLLPPPARRAMRHAWRTLRTRRLPAAFTFPMAAS